MVIREKNELFTFFGEEAADKRLLIWLWHFLVRTIGYQHFSGVQAFSPGHMAVILQSNENLKNQVLYKKSLNLIAPNHFCWMSNELRQDMWVDRMLQMGSLFGFAFNGYLGKSNVHHSLNWVERVILMFDLYENGAAEKINLLQKLEQGWNKHINNDSSFDWFRKKDEIGRCDFFWNWLLKQNPSAASDMAPMKSFQEIMIFFDARCVTQEEKLLMMERVKKAWSQKKYREGAKDKRQCNLLLSNKVLGLLDKLSVKHQLSRAAIVELLIHDESLSETYISKRLEKQQKFSLDF